jgi:hypothetical protein
MVSVRYEPNFVYNIQSCNVRAHQLVYNNTCFFILPRVSAVYLTIITEAKILRTYKVVEIWPGQTVTCLHTNSPGHIWTTLYITGFCVRKFERAHVSVWLTETCRRMKQTDVVKHLTSVLTVYG